MDLPSARDLTIASLGPGRFPSPLRDGGYEPMDGASRILLSSKAEDIRRCLDAGEDPPSFDVAGPREKLFFDPTTLTCGVVTCGGLCPGLNNVIRSIVLGLHHHYGVRRILGFRYGYAGLAASGATPPMELTPDTVNRIHESGGTLLGSSRGGPSCQEIADTLIDKDVGILFAIGGDGTLHGATAINAELRRRGHPTAVVGVPKTIDNDIHWIHRSFGFATAVEEARRVIRAANAEAVGTLNGIGLVKLMGRHAGFISAAATLASCDVNFCLVPEFPLILDGERGLLRALERRLADRHHAVVVVAEGAGQDLFGSDDAGRDASGNALLHDIGTWLRDRIVAHFRGRGTEFSMKYIDPSYIIRSLRANAYDSVLCLALGQNAVHAGMAGLTDVMVGYWNQEIVHVPIPVAIAHRRNIGERDLIWRRVLETTGQGLLYG